MAAKDETPPVATPPTATITPTPVTPTTTTTPVTGTTAAPAEPINPNDPGSAAAEAARKVAARINSQLGSNKPKTDVIADINTRFNQNAANAQQKQQQQQQEAEEKKEERPVYSDEIPINDFPQKARWRVTNKVGIYSNLYMG